ncbi:MAG: nitrate reductase catalytic subunit [Rhodospirillaceae bacterium]|nr:MAG: nitrate reductase catalytic subunit [Rhodospirillaceae bacterium]
MARDVKTTCPYCGVGCGVIATDVTPPGASAGMTAGASAGMTAGWTVRGDPDHPANRGRLCSKGTALAETLGLETRLLHPVVDGRVVGWEEAIAETAHRLRALIDAHGPDTFAFYLSGQLLTEDYYVANKLAKGFLGTANVDTNSRLCMASTDDLEQADLVVLVGTNLAWCHPVLFQRLSQAKKERGTRVVVIDPRRTETCAIADLYLPIASGGDGALFNRLLVHLDRTGHLDRRFIAAHTSGFTAALEAAAGDGEVSSPESTRFQDWFAATERVVTVFSQGVNQSAHGTDTVNAILNVHLATGRIGRPGMGPFSVTGQPNAMGGREVGGLANQLAAHMGFDPPSVDRVRRFWRAPRMATAEGLKAVDLFRAIGDGRVKAVWIIATNPAVSQPEADRVRQALRDCPLVIVSDCVADTDTVRLAHIRLPALAWGEKDGTVTNSDRTISRQRSFLPPPDGARADWQAVAAVATALGHGSAFAWRSPAEVFAEYARLTAFENEGGRDLDLFAWIDADYDTLEPRPWGGARFFADGRFFHADGRARFIAVRSEEPKESPSPAFPLRLNSGRYRDQWHTMTRTGLSARLSGHRPGPFLDMHPADAAKRDLAEGDLARVESRCGGYLARVRLTEDQREGEVFLPLHWSETHAACSVIGRLYPAHTDPISGQPESKHVPVRVSPFPMVWQGLLVCADLPPVLETIPWWVRRTVGQAHGVDLAGDRPEQSAALVEILDRRHGVCRLEVSDPVRGIARYGWLVEESLVAALFLGPRPADVAAIAPTWVAGRMRQRLDTPEDRAALLAGRDSIVREEEEGPLVCACFSVGLYAIERMIGERHLTTVAEVGAVLKAGTGCGSCIPALGALLRMVA